MHEQNAAIGLLVDCGARTKFPPETASIDFEHATRRTFKTSSAFQRFMLEIQLFST